MFSLDGEKVSHPTQYHQTSESVRHKFTTLRAIDKAFCVVTKRFPKIRIFLFTKLSSAEYRRLDNWHKFAQLAANNYDCF